MLFEKVKDTFKPIIEASKGALSKVKKLNIKELKLKNMKFDIKQIKKIDLPKLSKKIVDKKRFTVSVAAVALVLILTAYIYLSGVAYTVSINGSDIGKVRNKKDIEALLLQMKDQFKKQHNAEVGIAGELIFTKTRASSKDILDQKAIETFVKNDITYTIQSYSIVANGNSVAALKTKEEADKVLEQIKATYVKEADKAKYKEITFAEKVEVKQEFNETGAIMTVEEVASFVLKGTNEEKIHKVADGDSFWSISRKYNIKIDDLQKANPKADPNKIKIGQELSLVVPKPLLSVKTTEVSEYKENIPFEQKVENSSSLYKDQTSVKVKGAYGEREVVAEVVKINGIEDSRNILTEKIVKEPKTQILVKGTKELPPKKGTGTFRMPTRGSLTSRFGTRWGRQHEGIDLAAPIGTSVNAADGGVVIWVGTRGSFGKLIMVDHGGGYVTYYGHLSKYYVEKGDKVYKGEKIAAVGNTGRSTGPHLHFEIRKNGTPVNPLKYVK
jgi:murein DD-endopeptidase MepM/ murein hydrolase activator NlpD